LFNPFSVADVLGADVLGLKKSDSNSKSNGDATSFSENEEKIEFQEQAFLIKHYANIATLNFNQRYKNFISVHGDPAMLMTNLTSKNNIDRFLAITPQQLSQLTPTVRLFKVFYDKSNPKVEKDCVEFKFDDSLNASTSNDITSNRISRGAGAGLISFDWSFKGSNPATATKIIETTIKIRFSSMKELIESRIVSSEKKSERLKIRF